MRNPCSDRQHEAERLDCSSSGTTNSKILKKSNQKRSDLDHLTDATFQTSPVVAVEGVVTPPGTPARKQKSKTTHAPKIPTNRDIMTCHWHVMLSQIYNHAVE